MLYSNLIIFFHNVAAQCPRVFNTSLCCHWFLGRAFLSPGCSVSPAARFRSKTALKSDFILAERSRYLDAETAQTEKNQKIHHRDISFELLTFIFAVFGGRNKRLADYVWSAPINFQNFDQELYKPQGFDHLMTQKRVWSVFKSLIQIVCQTKFSENFMESQILIFKRAIAN